jgi:L-ascorbate metabolism protein UlaG (beta-lactamase superfamily)
MSATIISLGNAGFLVEAGGKRVYIDAFHGLPPFPGELPAERTAGLILVTHAHWDHFKARPAAAAAGRTGAAVAGPATVTAALRGRVPPERLIELEPPAAPGGGGPLQPAALQARGIGVTAYRTVHSRDHNSYRVELPGLRFFHDGDNEDTRRLDASALGGLDALFIGPWRGSGYIELVERLAPRRWFLMHLTRDELEEQERGTFLTATCGCDRVPPGLVALRPGERFEL